MGFRAIKSDRARTKGVRYRSQPVLEKAKARALFKAVARRRQQETHSHPRKPSRPKSKIKSKSVFLRRSHGEGSRKPVANRTDQAIQKSKIKSKSGLRQGGTDDPC